MMEEIAYRDMWKDGLNSYIEWFAPFVADMSNILSPKGSFYLHCDPTISHYLKLILDAEFDYKNFRNEITWKRRAESHNRATNHMGRIHDSILYFAKSRESLYNIQYLPYSEEYMNSHYKYRDERGHYATFPCTNEAGGNKEYDFMGITRAWRFSPSKMLEMYDNNLLVQPRSGSPFRYKKYAVDADGVKLQDIWDEVTGVRGNERTGYPTQKPEALLERIIKASSNEGDLVLDCFVGSGTTAAVAEKLGRRWIAVDIGRFAIQTTRKRLLDIPDCKPFEVQNLGKYERTQWQPSDTSSKPNSTNPLAQYLAFILELYKAQSLRGQFSHIHGIREGRAVHIGSTDSPISADEMSVTVDECASNGFNALDMLGWEWEMGIDETKDQLAHTRSVDVRLFQIPREILDQRNIDAGGINFFQRSVASAEIIPLQKNSVQVEITEFIPAVDEYMLSKLTGQLPKWSDWIDYWSVDFEYDGGIFVNQWQAYRTRRERKLNLISDPHEYEAGDREPKTIAVKIIDIFGNDTTIELNHNPT